MFDHGRMGLKGEETGRGEISLRPSIFHEVLTPLLSAYPTTAGLFLNRFCPRIDIVLIKFTRTYFHDFWCQFS